MKNKFDTVSPTIITSLSEFAYGHEVLIKNRQVLIYLYFHNVHITVQGCMQAVWKLQLWHV